MKEFIINYILIPQASAQTSIHSLIGKINEYIINPLIAVLFTLAFVLFVTGLFNFFMNKDNNDALDKGKRHMTWGIVGMVIMVSVFGIMNLIINTFDVKGISPEEGTVSLPR